MPGRKAVVMAMPAPAPQSAKKAKKTVEAVQAAIDALPANSGDWSVAGTLGLFVRCGARGVSYRLQRRIRGRLVVQVLGEMTIGAARRAAMKEWVRLRPVTPEGKTTLAEAYKRFLEERDLAPKTRFMMNYNLDRYLGEWKTRTLEDLGADRAGVRNLFLRLVKKRGKATAGQALAQFRSVYNYYRRVQPELPETPTVAVGIPAPKARDWALSPDELCAWWAAVGKLNPLKKMLWQAILWTGARRGSVEALRWCDVDFERVSIHFSTAKAGRVYTIPACRRLVEALKAWRAECPPTAAGWVFPSPQKPEAHITAARDDKRGVVSAHHLRHTFRTYLAELGATPDQARLLLGHSLGGDVSRSYITPHLLVESLRPLAEAVADRYAKILRRKKSKGAKK